ncbi:MAG: PilT/PilU family type 4a pilus ATPase [Lachnospiraceae bacterium]|nr:PilT/PilU family type 4a pilus ATPase [Lachnospiraceae bacterium]
MLDIRVLLTDAASKGASDIHLAVGAPPSYRINGVLVPAVFPVMTPGDTLEVLLNIMGPDQREAFEKKYVIDISMSVQSVGRIRVNAYKQRGYITITMRLVDVKIPDPEALSIPEAAQGLCEEKRGLVFVTGPAGSGKSTVTASLIDRINDTRYCNIITIEDPVEYLHRNKKSIVNQREIGVDAIDRVSALTSALRQDPDVIAAGEVRDEEEAYLILTAAETGRLVFSSLYTMSASGTIEAFLDLFPEQKRRQAANRLSNVLKAVISRQLVTSLEGKLVPAFEFLMSDNPVKKMIRENRISEIDGYMKNNPDKGFITMDDSLTGLCKNGVISSEEAIQASVDQEQMALSLSDH